jgi:hypothetical protein
MTPHVTIRRATPSNAHVVLSMMREIAAEEGVGSVHLTVPRLRGLLDRDDVTVLVAWQEPGTALGYVSAVRQLNLWAGGPILAAADRLLVRWEAEETNTAAHRFYTRLGARLRSKTIATWHPDAYTAADPSGQAPSNSAEKRQRPSR